MFVGPYYNPASNFCVCVCVCRNYVISTSKLFQTLYYKQKRCQSRNLLGESGCSEKTSKMFLKELALDSHRTALQEGSIDIYQWKGHLAR